MNIGLPVRDAARRRARNPYSEAQGLWIPASLPEPAIGPAFGRTRRAAPRNNEEKQSQ
jgi:hypothetical protein